MHMKKPISIQFYSLLLIIIFAFEYLSAQDYLAKPQVPADKTPTQNATGAIITNPTLAKIFSRFEFEMAVDSIMAQVGTSSRDISPSFFNLLIYKLKVRWLFRDELKLTEVQFLTNYFEDKLKVTLTKDRRFAFLSGQDLKTLMIRATDTTLQIKNTLMESQLREYAQTRNAHAIVSIDVLITDRQIMYYFNINDLNGLTVWSKEYKAFHNPYPPRITDILSDLDQQLSFQKKTGLPVWELSMSFLYGTANKNGKADPQGSVGYVMLGYRYNEYATIIDRLSFFVDTKAMYGLTYGKFGLLMQPGLGIELYGPKDVGPRILMVDIMGGYHITPNSFSLAYGAELKLKLSRLLGLSGFYNYLADQKDKKNYYPAGSTYGAQIFFIL
jgi:hypothetical protein